MDFAAIARAAGFHAVGVEEPTECARACARCWTTTARRSWTPSTDPDALEIPPHVTGEEVEGFALSTAKMVVGGGIGNVLEMARANLRNIPRP